MALDLSVSLDESVVTIGITGPFDFRIHREFRDTLHRCMSPGRAYRVDLAGVDYLDSSALGMLLLLREHAGGDDARVALVGARTEVRQILTIANFDKMFEIR